MVSGPYDKYCCKRKYESKYLPAMRNLRENLYQIIKAAEDLKAGESAQYAI